MEVRISPGVPSLLRMTHAIEGGHPDFLRGVAVEDNDDKAGDLSRAVEGTDEAGNAYDVSVRATRRSIQILHFKGGLDVLVVILTKTWDSTSSMGYHSSSGYKRRNRNRPSSLLPEHFVHFLDSEKRSLCFASVREYFVRFPIRHALLYLCP